MNSTVSVYNIMATTSEVSLKEKPKAVPIMLSGDALSFITNHILGTVAHTKA